MKLLLKLLLTLIDRLTDRAVEAARGYSSPVGVIASNIVVTLESLGQAVEGAIFNRAQKKLSNAPGTMARRILAFVFPAKVFSGVFAQAIADMREEHADALNENRPWCARWIELRGNLGLAVTALVYISTTVVKKCVGIWKLIP